MRRRHALSLLSTLAGCTRISRAAPLDSETSVSAALEKIRADHKLPGLAGVIVTSSGIHARGAVGVRRRGASAAVTADDLWHIGSLTKAMTSVLAGKMADAGKLRWNSTADDLFGTEAAGWPDAFRGITLANLLTHRSGLPANFEPSWDELPARTDRPAVVKQLAAAGRGKPDSAYLYSNAGYVMAGAAMERISGKLWEELITAELFKPLGMSRTGFGGTGTPGKIDQPWPHNADGSPVPRNGPATDNPPVLGPAGTVHLPVIDYGLFLAEVLRSARRRDGLIKAATARTLHTPAGGGDYACGWTIARRDWAGGNTLSHNGTNNMNYAVAWIAPEKDLAVAVFSNQGGDRVFKACDAAVVSLLGF